jgi:hypothetical protein
MEPPPLNIRKAPGVQFQDKDKDADADDTLNLPITTPPISWDAFQALMGTRASRFFAVEDDIKPHWDIYNDLGGLTDLTDKPSRRVSHIF